MFDMMGFYESLRTVAWVRLSVAVLCGSPCMCLWAFAYVCICVLCVYVCAGVCRCGRACAFAFARIAGRFMLLSFLRAGQVALGDRVSVARFCVWHALLCFMLVF